MSPSDTGGRIRLVGGTVLHLDPPRVEQADIHVEGGRVVELVSTDGPTVAETGADASVVDATGCWVMPGLVCGHHHLYSALACGMPQLSEPPTSFADMLAKVWWRLDEALDAESVRVSGLVGGLGALRSGVTTIVDHHASPGFIEGSLEVLDEALGSVGVRRVLCYEVTDRGGPERAAAGLRAHEGLLGKDGGGRRAVMVGAHANFTLSDRTLERCGALAREAGVGLHIHVAEAVDDRENTGGDLVARMERLGALQPGSLLAHCVHLQADALRRIEDAGAWVSHQPRSNMNNAVGYAPLSEFGYRTILGTDGIGSDMLTELQTGWFRAQEAGVPWSPERWLQVLAASARFAGERLGVRLGRIEPGAAADLLVLDPQPGPPLTEDNLAAAFLFRLSAQAVRHVVVDGHMVLRDRMPVLRDGGIRDVAALDRRAQRVSTQLWERMR